MKKSVLILCFLLLFYFSGETTFASNCDVFLKDHTIYVNEVILKDLYVPKGVTLYIDGNCKVMGSIYNWGTVIVNKDASLDIKYELYTLNYESYTNHYERRSCSNNKYGIVRNYGNLKVKTFCISEKYLNKEVVINQVKYYPNTYKSAPTSKCLNMTYISQSCNIANSKINQDVYIDQNANCIINKQHTLDINGDLYIYGSLNVEGTLKVSGKIYCMNYGLLHASKNNNGTLKGKGKISCNKVIVDSKYYNNQVVLQHQNKQIIEYAGMNDSGYVVNRCLSCNKQNSLEYLNAIKKISLSEYNYTYDGNSKKPEVIVKDGNGIKINSNYYTITYDKARTKAGTYQVIVKLQKYYQGNKTLKFVINAKDINTLKVDTIKNQIYSGSDINVSVNVKDQNKVLKKNVDYQVKYQNNCNVGTASVVIEGINNYKGSKKVTFQIQPRDINKATIKNIENKTYTGSKIELNVDVVDHNQVLKKGVDYKICYEDNKDVGKAKIIIHGINNYTGTITKQFNIKAKSLTHGNIKMINEYEYTGNQIKPKLQLYVDSYLLSEKKHYEIKYGSNKSCGLGWVEVKGIHNYQGSIKNYFVIKPKDSKITSLKSNMKKQMTIKVNNISGAQIQISYKEENGAFKHIYTSSETLTLKNLNSSKTYYVKVRHFIKENGITYFSNYSTLKQVKIK